MYIDRDEYYEVDSNVQASLYLYFVVRNCHCAQKVQPVTSLTVNISIPSNKLYHTNAIRLEKSFRRKVGRTYTLLYTQSCLHVHKHPPPTHTLTKCTQRTRKNLTQKGYNNSGSSASSCSFFLIFSSMLVFQASSLFRLSKSATAWVNLSTSSFSKESTISCKTLSKLRQTSYVHPVNAFRIHQRTWCTYHSTSRLLVEQQPCHQYISNTSRL